MPHAEPRTSGNDALDDLFAFDETLDDAFDAQDAPTGSSGPKKGLGEETGGTRNDLGIDDEVIITKKRAPIAKLDETRLLSKNGITKLRYTAKNKLKFRGKGHEFSDMQKLLSVYQLWLDDLYPRAKFADGLVILEKLGHSKRIQMMRKEWIDEGKPNRARDEDSDDAGLGRQSVGRATPTPAAFGEEEDEDDMFEALREDEQQRYPSADDRVHQRPDSDVRVALDEDAKQPEEDELDALLAESSRNEPTAKAVPPRDIDHPVFSPSAASKKQDDPFAAEMEAMQEMEGMW